MQLAAISAAISAAPPAPSSAAQTAARASAQTAANPAEAGRIPSEISLFVADAQGGAWLWRFVLQGHERLDSPLGAVLAQHWRRDALRPEGQQVDVWLDAARGHWPVLLRYTALRTGERFELQLAAEPTPAP